MRIICSDQPRYRLLFSGPLLPLALSARVSLLGSGAAGTGLALGWVYALRGVSEAWSSRRPLLVPSIAQSIRTTATQAIAITKMIA
jgi:hypothetical protein